jgi:hypothetical protein
MDYKVLLQSPLSGVDVAALGEELSAETWTRDSAVVKALLEMGAQDVIMKPQSRDMALLIPLGIPWDNITKFWRLSGGNDKQEEALPMQKLSVVTALHSVDLGPQDVRMKSVFQVPLAKLNLHLLVALAQDSYIFSAAVEFVNHEGTGILDHKTVRHFMELGFLQSAKLYGKVLLAELLRRGKVAELGEDSGAEEGGFWARLR